jgi:diguanylate cyclase (GGDEF)-like protein
MSFIFKNIGITTKKTIRDKLIINFAAFTILVCAFGLAAMLINAWMATNAALTEAEHVAEMIASNGIIDPLEHKDELQQHIMKVHRLQKRDVFVVDRNLHIVADSDADEIGTTFTFDPEGVIGQTMRDGVLGKFIEHHSSAEKPSKLVVIPLRRDQSNAESEIVGALSLEYTAIYDELMESAYFFMKLILLLLALFLGITYTLSSRISRSIIVSLSRLQSAIEALIEGNHHARVAITSEDEVAQLASCVNRLADKMEATFRDKEERLAANAEQLRLVNNRLADEVQQHKLSAERSEYFAYYDHLTTLPNRRMFSHLLGHAIALASARATSLGLLFIDLDEFKHINDTLGHAAGDELLISVAGRLKACLRAGDTTARLGGDEFVILVENLREKSHLEALAAKLLDALQPAHHIAGAELRITASIGISIFPDDGQDESALMKNADMAMYQAKRHGKNNCQLYCQKLKSETEHRFMLESGLRQALEKQEFALVYQPKVCAISGRIVGAEALLRWNAPAGFGEPGPCDFIPVAEDSGLIVPIGRWVLETVCMQHREWAAQGFGELSVSVNLSARQLADSGFYDDVLSIVADTGMDCARLEFELTESAAMKNMDQTIALMKSMRDQRMRISLDDFGTGYSSLSMLKQLPVDIIKIDRSFIRDMPGNAQANALTHAIIAMSKVMNLRVVAEGVETLQQVNFLKECDCDELQGFYFSRPVSPQDFLALLEQQGHLAAPSSDSGNNTQRVA